ncbi:tryptophan synthase alpha chain [Kitasatospora xanthocidica]|uniref:tryptophan synthase subunit alpha n=1 Tax=Kitasatospora xanthocidica TaxID=83382 RepID=UPI001675CE17|nr:tryptophan synthase subunit alpha [Kitasatospora xanthocidica]GHF86371.1 tryptophan synthase alpha chain [Kitasatospora xanthocidica]
MSEPLFPPGELGLAVFLNAGDPAGRLTDLAHMLDASGVDVLELAVPFPNSPTDGALIRRSAARALAHGTTLDTVLAQLAGLTPHLKRLKVVLLADWSHSLRHRDPAATARAVADAGAAALLIHALPPRLRPAWHHALRTQGLPQVTTCYPASAPEVLTAAAQGAAGAYVYLVAHYGRSGTTPAHGHRALADTVTALRRAAPATPVAVGFGVRTAADLAAVADSGAHAAIVGSAAVARIEHAHTEGLDPVTELSAFLTDLRPHRPPHPDAPGGRTTGTTPRTTPSTASTTPRTTGTATPTTASTTTREEQPAC